MSIVTGIILSTSCDEDMSAPESPWNLVNAWLVERNYGELKAVDDQFGGEKHPQITVAGGGYNQFPEEEFAKFVLSLDWATPENVVLVVQPEDGPPKVHLGSG